MKVGLKEDSIYEKRRDTAGFDAFKHWITDDDIYEGQKTASLGGSSRLQIAFRDFKRKEITLPSSTFVNDTFFFSLLLL